MKDAIAIVNEVFNVEISILNHHTDGRDLDRLRKVIVARLMKETVEVDEEELTGQRKESPST